MPEFEGRPASRRAAVRAPRGLEFGTDLARRPPALRHRRPDHDGPERDRQAAVGGRLLAGRRAGVLGRLPLRRPARDPARDPRERLGAGPLAREPAQAADRVAGGRRRRSRPARPATSSSSSPGTPRTARGPGTASSGCTTTARRRDRPQPLRPVRFADAWAVAEHLHAELPELEAATRAFHAALFGWHPAGRGRRRRRPRPWSCCAAPPALLLDDGTADGLRRLGGELRPRRQLRGHLHPRLELRPDRRLAVPRPGAQRPAHGVPARDRDDGRMSFRTNSVFGNDPDGVPSRRRRPAGHDRAALPRVALQRRRRLPAERLAGRPPRARVRLHRLGLRRRRRARQPAAQHLRHRVLRRELARQLDVLRRAAGASRGMAEHLGDDRDCRPLARGRRARRRPHGRRCSSTASTTSSASTTSTRTATSTARAASPTSCSARCYAHLDGLGHLLPADHVRSAVGAIFRHNFRRDFSGTTACSARTP